MLSWREASAPLQLKDTIMGILVLLVIFFILNVFLNWFSYESLTDDIPNQTASYKIILFRSLLAKSTDEKRLS